MRDRVSIFCPFHSLAFCTPLVIDRKFVHFVTENFNSKNRSIAVAVANLSEGGGGGWVVEGANVGCPFHSPCLSTPQIINFVGEAVWCHVLMDALIVRA